MSVTENDEPCASVVADEPVASTCHQSDSMISVVEENHTEQGSNNPTSGSDVAQAEQGEQTMNVEQDKPTVHVLDILPLQKATHKLSRRVGRASVKTVVLTFSHYKQELVNKRQTTLKVSSQQCMKKDREKAENRKKKKKKWLTCREDKPRGRPKRQLLSLLNKGTQLLKLNTGSKTIRKAESSPKMNSRPKPNVVNNKLVCFCGEVFTEPPT